MLPRLCRLELVPDKLGCWYKLVLEGPLISRLLREPLLTRRCRLVQLMVLDLCTLLLLPLPFPKSSSCSSSSQMAASKGKTVQQPPPGAEIILTHSFRASARLSCRSADLDTQSFPVVGQLEDVLHAANFCSNDR